MTNSPVPAGACDRLQKPDATSVSGEEPPTSLAVVFATIERPQVAQRLILSVRRRFPKIPIYVADQSLDVSAMSTFYEHMNVQLVRMTYDAGVCASRNRLVACIKEDFFVLCDDDFVFGERTEFSDALRILNRNPEIGVVGGRLYDYDGKEEYIRNWELFLNLDEVNRILTSVPIYHYAPRAHEAGMARFYMCDAVMNFSVMRRAIFEQPAIRWDERFKSNGEHEDFFLNMKVNSMVRVAYLPTMVAYHHHPEQFVAYRSKLRDRIDGWRRMFEKWSIDQHVEIGLGVRSIDKLHSVVAYDDAKERFFLNRDLSLRRRTTDSALLVGRGSKLYSLGALDERGEPSGITRDTSARLVLRAENGKVCAAPEARTRDPEGSGHVADVEGAPHLRHSFVSSRVLLESIGLAQRVQFRYNPIARHDADFVLWYRVTSKQQPAPGAFNIHLRWFAQDGRVLVWESKGYLLDIAYTDYWAPVSIELPMCPRACAYLRFEVVAGSAGNREQLAVGFLFGALSGESSTPSCEQPPSSDVLALTPFKFRADDMLPPADLSELPVTKSAANLTLRYSPQVPALTLIALDGLNSLETLFVFGWAGFGAPVSVVQIGLHDLSGTDPCAPRELALPRQAEQGMRMVGYIREQGYEEIPLTLPFDDI